MRSRMKWFLAVLIPLIPMLAFATSKPFTNGNCASLASPKTVLLVHASWCPHCKAFKPIYEQVSNEEKYKDWLFYEMVNDKFESVCGKSITGVPITFKNNMKNYLNGNRSSTTLEQFLDSKN